MDHKKLIELEKEFKTSLLNGLKDKQVKRIKNTGNKSLSSIAI